MSYTIDMTLPQIRRLAQHVRLIIAGIIARSLTRISVSLHLGSGSVIGGRAALFLDPHLLEELTSGRRVVLVSGTNGKTTTTRMIAYALSEPAPETASGANSDTASRYNGRSTESLDAEHLYVATSLSGSNLPAGIVSALIGSEKDTDAVLEVDEGYLPELIAKSHPAVVVLLNLSRDQLDRVNEVRMTSSKWRKALIDALQGQPAAGEKPESTGKAAGQAAKETTGRITEQAASESKPLASLQVVANCDDPMIVWAASGIPESHVTWVSAGQRWTGDATSCPNCGGSIVFTGDRAWSCECGFARPIPSVAVNGDKMTIDGHEIPLVGSLPGQFNLSNTAMAVTAASLLGKSPLDSIDRIAKLTSVAGRFASLDVELVDSHDPTCTVEATVVMMLAKNPAGWLELIDLLTDTDTPVVIGINAKIADGLDPSWLWDVPFERIAQKSVTATGLRGLDLAVRLSYAGVEHGHAEDQLKAIAMSAVTGTGVGADTGDGVNKGADAATSDNARTPNTLIDYVGNYTAFQELRKALSTGSPIRINGLAAITKEAGSATLVHKDRSERGRSTAATQETTANNTSTGRHTARDSSLRIVSLYPDILGTYGDGGNALILAVRAEQYGFDAELLQIHAGDDLPTQCDIYCIGGGEDAPQAYAAQLLRSASARIALNRALSGGAAMLAVCAGYQIIGESFPGSANSIHQGVGLVPAATVKTTQPRAVGEIICRSPCLGDQLLTGFENHAGRTAIGQEAEAFGRVLKGIGNGIFEDGSEGIVYGNIIGTYMHGPVLARNSVAADGILSMATGGILPAASAKLDSIEQAVRELRLRLLKKSRL